MSKRDNGFFLKVGDRVTHIKDPGSLGTVKSIDVNLIEGYGVTTTTVRWDDADEDDIVWSNKLERVDEGGHTDIYNRVKSAAIAALTMPKTERGSFLKAAYEDFGLNRWGTEPDDYRLLGVQVNAEYYRLTKHYWELDNPIGDPPDELVEISLAHWDALTFLRDVEKLSRQHKEYMEGRACE